MPTDTIEIPDSHRDLLDEQFATLATVGEDGRPQLSEVWFLAEDDGTVRVSLNTTRQKSKNLLADPVVDLFILDLKNPYRYLELRGDALLAPDARYEFADRVGEKYDTDLRQMDGPGDDRIVVTIQPTHVNAVDMSQG